MYTQNNKNTQINQGVVSFPNTDSIIQMKAICGKEIPTKLTYEKEIKPETAENPNDYLLLFGLILSVCDTYKIGTELLPLIAGIILTI